MITKGSNQSGATFSDCENYRYVLWRRWNSLFNSPRMCAFIGLNPSTADENWDDPTIRRCIGFARAWGYDGLYMLNLFAFRATDPADMKRALRPIGEPENDEFIGNTCNESAIAIAAWGSHGSHLRRDEVVKGCGLELHMLRLNQDGSPAHPLYLPKNLIPTIWRTGPLAIVNEART